jgi:hypothetical protein
LPSVDIVRAYGTAMCESSRAGRIATGRLSNFAAAHNARQAWPPIALARAGGSHYPSP